VEFARATIGMEADLVTTPPMKQNPEMCSQALNSIPVNIDEMM